MKIITAIDSMKGSLSSEEANLIIEKVFKDESIVVEKVAVADGGEGTVQAFVTNGKWETVRTTCSDPRGKKVEVEFGWLQDEKTAIIESSSSCGIHFIDHTQETHPRNTNSYGLGEQILSACRIGADKIIVGLGGTGTIDCGIGMMASLGVKFFDSNGKLVSPFPANFSIITSLSTKDVPKRISKLEVLIATDVQSLITGEFGAVHMFGEQKGLKANERETYERDIARFSQLLLNGSSSMPGDGAAGGLGLALRKIFNAQVCSGLELVAQYTNLEKKIKDSDIVITGEGKIDSQSFQGKVPIGIAILARKYDIPVIAFVGEMLGDPIEFEEAGISTIVPIVNQVSTLEQAIADAEQNLLFAATRVKKLLFLIK